MACTYDPTSLVGVPLGMFHCPECGEMVVAGVKHPDYELLDALMGSEQVQVDETTDKKVK